MSVQGVDELVQAVGASGRDDFVPELLRVMMVAGREWGREMDILKKEAGGGRGVRWYCLWYEMVSLWRRSAPCVGLGVGRQGRGIGV